MDESTEETANSLLGEIGCDLDLLTIGGEFIIIPSEVTLSQREVIVCFGNSQSAKKKGAVLASIVRKLRKVSMMNAMMSKATYTCQLAVVGRENSTFSFEKISFLRYRN